MSLEPDHVLLWVADMDRALRFYSDIIRLRISISTPRFSVVCGERFCLALHLSGNQAPGTESGASIVVFYSENIDDVYLDFLNHGVEIITSPTEAAPGVRIFECCDTEGNIFSVSTARFLEKRLRGEDA
ncbi:VOC family protein [Mesorhizobium sp. M1148]|uniref:VOC family protein n=1 Tax=unclassified Mesorhizobium TaxID=325217 RepID=UPI00333A98F9